MTQKNSLADRRPGAGKFGQLARLVNRAASRGTLQRYIVRHRFDTEENKLTEQDVRDDPRWSRLNSRQQAELLRRVGSSRKELLDDAFTASAILFRDDEPAHAEVAPPRAPSAHEDEEPAIVPPSREGAHLDAEKMFGSEPPPPLHRPVAIPLATRLRHHAVTFGASEPAYLGPPHPTEFNFPVVAPKAAPPKPATPPPSSPFTFSFGTLGTGTGSQPTSGQGFSFGSVPTGPSSEAVVDQDASAKPASGFTFGSTAPTSSGFSFGSTATPSFSGFTFGSGTETTPSTGGFSFGFGAPAQPPPTFAAPPSTHDEDSDDDEEDDPDRFVQSDQHNHQVLMNNPRYAAMVASTFQQRGPINVRTDVASGAGAAWRSEENRISITSKFTGARRASAMVFEMTNAFHTPRADAVKAQAETLGEDRYAIESERIEYDGLRKHHEIMSYGVAHLGWPPELDRYAKLLAGKWSTFDGYLKAQEFAGHTNMHRSNHKIMMGQLERERVQAKAAMQHAGSKTSRDSL